MPFFFLSFAGVSFTPREVGEHQVSVKRMGKHIANSPFTITVGDQEVGDAKKVNVYGETLREGKTHEDNTFNVDTRNAGMFPPNNIRISTGCSIIVMAHVFYVRLRRSFPFH